MTGWKILRKLSSGAMGEVYLAVTPDQQSVALKVLLGSSASDQSFFEDQVRMLIRLRHTAVVSVQGYLWNSREIFGENRGPCYWMDYVEGDDILSAAGRSNVSAILGWFRDSLSALEYVQGQGVVHGDLSPKNILIDSQDRVHLIDFGIFPGEAARSDLATLPYMAPERIDGRLLPSGDLFSLGTIFYQTLSGRHPRAGCRSVQELLRAEPAPLLEVAPLLSSHVIESRIIDRMIIADTGRRFSNAAGILEALHQGASDTPVEDVAEDYPVRMLGADRCFAILEEALVHLPEKSAAFAVHGSCGVGKSRFVSEVGFEAAMRGSDYRVFQDLHRSGLGERAHLLSLLRNLPNTGVLVMVTWDDDALSEESRRFTDRLLSTGLVQNATLKNLDKENTLLLLSCFLEPDAAAEALDVMFEATLGNPSRILEALKRLRLGQKIRRRLLMPGWKDGLSVAKTPEPPPPEDAVERSRFLRRKINQLNALGRYQEALVVCDEWFALKADDEPIAFKAVKYWFVTGLNHQNLDHHDEAERRLRRCLETGRDHANDEAIASYLVRAHSLLGVHDLKQGRFEAAIREFQDSLKWLKTGDPARAEIDRNMARVLSRSGHWGQAQALLEEAKSLYRKTGNAEGEFWSWLEEGNLKLDRNDFDGTEQAYGAAEALIHGETADLFRALVWNNRGLLESARGRLATSLDLLRKAHDVFQFLGNANDLAQNIKELGIAEASVGRFQAAEELLKTLNDKDLLTEAEAVVKGLRNGDEGGAGVITDAARLREIYDDLPPGLQVSFVDRGDYRRLNPPVPKERKQEMAPSPALARVPEFLPLLNRLNRDLLSEDDMGKVLNRLMDAAMTLANAENGFLVVTSDTEKSASGPLPGYEIAVARNVTLQAIQTDLYAFSLSAVRRALQTGEPVVTDNALIDPLFKEARSVHLRRLKSIVALPILDPEAAAAPIGVFYLDHRFENGLFDGDVLKAMEAFAGIAALALQKGRMIDALRRSNEELVERVSVQNREITRSRLILKNRYSEIIGRSPKMVEVLSMVDKITDAKIPVWIFGESGTGKEAIARALHFNSGRAKRPFVTENCGALPENLLESELFGHKKGAFTHATADKKGVLQYADGGTIFLDEIADMSPNLQAKLLRFLQDGEIRPIGSNDVVHVDVRVVSASNKDLPTLVAQGRFREDLFYRLNGITVKLPPLRERMEDLPLLTEYFLKTIAEREKRSTCRLDPRALDLFLNYGWPGNIRELQNTLETAVLFQEAGVIGTKALHFKPQLSERPVPPTAVPSRAPNAPLDPILEKTLSAIRDNCYHKGYAAEALGITRRALYARLQKFGLKSNVKSLKEKIEEYWDRS